MEKPNIGKKLYRDKKGKEIRKTIKQKQDNNNKGNSYISPIQYWNTDPKPYSDIYKTKNLLEPNVKGLFLELGNKQINNGEEKYNKPYKYGLYFSNVSYKKIKLYQNKGFNKGKTGLLSVNNNVYRSYFAKKDCVNDEIELVHKYKDNSPKEPNPDKPICVVCYYNNCGMGRYIFKKCRHGRDLCGTCARQLITCPVCRADRR
jgi:hypothetical protein